ncbi:MAG: protease HtpX [Simkaniaceae bacterium]|nr:protease HtpX [Simkaniaceae bacterium]
MFKRIGWFVLLNFLVIATISVLLRLFNVQPYLTAHGISYQDLIGLCLIWGMGGALISLALSRIMAKMMMGIRTEDPRLDPYRNTLSQLARKANLPVTPEFGLFESPELNAFATGPTQSRALVAVSSALLREMTPQEIEGVLAHEISHIANGDMVTMTLIQGVVNAFVMFLARVLAFAISRKDRRGDSYFLVFIFEIIFMLVGSIVVAFFSRIREYRADREGSLITSRATMISALTRLSHSRPGKREASLQTLMMNGGGMWSLFATHPPIEERIARLKAPFCTRQ